MRRALPCSGICGPRAVPAACPRSPPRGARRPPRRGRARPGRARRGPGPGAARCAAPADVRGLRKEMDEHRARVRFLSLAARHRRRAVRAAGAPWPLHVVPRWHDDATRVERGAQRLKERAPQLHARQLAGGSASALRSRGRRPPKRPGATRATPERRSRTAAKTRAATFENGSLLRGVPGPGRPREARALRPRRLNIGFAYVEGRAARDPEGAGGPRGASAQRDFNDPGPIGAAPIGQRP